MNSITAYVSGGPLMRHRALVATLYVIALACSIRVLTLDGAAKDSVSLLSSGAILATFGSALATLGSVWERDLLERVRLNVDILFRDLLGESNPWRRWPFLARYGERQNLDGTRLRGILANPVIALDVGTHSVKIEVPTILEDFFDLSVRANLIALSRFRTASATVWFSKSRTEKELVSADSSGNQPAALLNPSSEPNGSSLGNEFMQFECLYDTWRSILSFRIARYLTHFGAAVTLSGTLTTSFLFV